METESRRSVITLLPDDVVMDILRRMSVLDVFKCRRVCRRWRDLVSTQHFQQMHLKACRSPVILIQRFRSIKDKSALLVLDKWESPRKKPTIRRSRPNFIDNSGSGSIDVQLSCDGLIVIKSTVPVNGFSVFTILNPISGDAVRIETPDSGFHVQAMFFDPSIKEYCLLFRSYTRVIGLEILNLGAQPCFRSLKQPVSFLYLVRIGYCRRPVIVDDHATVYWLVEGGCNLPCEEVIMAFDIKTERFTYLSHPHPIHNCQSSKHNEDENMRIMNIDGSLSFVTIAHENTLRIINIWTLKDSATGLWTKTHSVSTDISLVIPPLWTSISSFKVMAVGRGEIFLHYGGVYGGIYLYNLELGTLRRIGKPYLSRPSSSDAKFFFFKPSSVSLRNCKPLIRISRDDIRISRNDY